MYNRKSIFLAVNDVPLIGIQTVNHINSYYASLAFDLVENVSNNNNHPHADNNLNATCVLRETIARMKLKKYSDRLWVRNIVVMKFSQIS